MIKGALLSPGACESYGSCNSAPYELGQIDEVQPIEESDHATQRTQEAAKGPLGEQPDCQQCTA